MGILSDILFFPALAVFIIGVILFALGGVCFRFRAFTNKRAWDGATKPLLGSGVLISILGLILVFITYPQY